MKHPSRGRQPLAWPGLAAGCSSGPAAPASPSLTRRGTPKGKHGRTQGPDWSWTWRLVLAVLVMALAAACSSAGHAGSATQATTGHPAAASALDSQRTAFGSVVLDGSPGTPAANTRTGTLYVPIQCPDSFCNTDNPAHVVDVINAATCNAKVRSGCRVVARATAGTSPNAAVVDENTDTIYVTNSVTDGNDGTVSVLNGARCNARVTAGCSTPVATIKLGGFVVAAALNPATHTLYVADLKGGVDVIDVAACSAVTTHGCAEPIRKIRDGQGPAALDIDVATGTVYAVNNGTGNGDTVSVIDGATCNGTDGSGCGQAPRTTAVGSGASWAALDEASHTVYVTNANDGTVSVINGARCNARVPSGCGRTWPTVTAGAVPGFVAVDPSSGTAYTVNVFDDTLAVINTRTCNGTTTSGCAGRPRNEQATPHQNPGFNSFPNELALVPQTRTAYVVNVGGRDVMSVVSVSHCNATDTTGCRTEAPSVPAHEATISADPATGTIYASNTSRPQIDVLNAATCHTGNLTGCAPVAEIPVGHPMANVSAVDAATRTLYAADPTAGTVAAINAAACNAATTTGCAQHPPVIKIGASPNTPVINPATRTLYVSYGSNANQVAVVNTATCNATRTSGCRQTPAVVKVGTGTAVLAVSTATNTIYAPNSGTSFSGHTMSVINGATCNGSKHSGCSRLAATVTVGSGPFGVAVNDRTHTVYVVNNAFGDSPGTVSVINGATCNGTVTGGCGQRFPIMATGIAPQLAAIDAATGTIYVTDFGSAGVTVLNGSHCNATVTSGCGAPPREEAVGSEPIGLAIYPHAGTVYVIDTFRAGSMSLLPSDLGPHANQPKLRPIQPVILHPSSGNAVLATVREEI
jgi:DNA-binding beta-propeller fold protein YncE